MAPCETPHPASPPAPARRAWRSCFLAGWSLYCPAAHSLLGTGTEMGVSLASVFFFSSGLGSLTVRLSVPKALLLSHQGLMLSERPMLTPLNSWRLHCPSEAHPSAPWPRPAGPSRPWKTVPTTQEQPALSECMAILEQGGSWEDAGEVRVGREGGGFSVHDYVSRALWRPSRGPRRPLGRTHPGLRPSPASRRGRLGAGTGSRS